MRKRHFRLTGIRISEGRHHFCQGWCRFVLAKVVDRIDSMLREGSRRRQARIRDDDSGEAVRVFRHQTQTNQSAPVLPDEGGSLDLILSEPRGHPIDLALVAEIFSSCGLVRPAKSDEIGREHTKSRFVQDRDHMTIEITPGRLTVHTQNGFAVPRTFVEVMDSKASAVAVRYVGVVGVEGVAR